MCLYASDESGLAKDIHLVHYGARALGGVGLLNFEAISVTPEGRNSLADLGIWHDGQIEPLKRIIGFCQEQGAATCVQLAHHGRKSWSDTLGRGPQPIIAPSAVAHAEGWAVPAEMSLEDIRGMVGHYQEATRRVLQAGIDSIEIHAAHGYLINQFLSPVSNFRKDGYGGSLSNRMRFLMEVTEAVRQALPESQPLIVRLSVVEWCDDGISLEDSIEIAKALKTRGVEMIDCSSGGILTDKPPRLGPGYQIPFSEAIRSRAQIMTMAVGSVSTAELAEEILLNGRADMVALGRELLHNPHWPLDAARILGDTTAWPKIYAAGKSSLGCR
jgi:2,4-dienoyl-CoA reductase-like NADH-dependent reductase (Old Yellow Enzyme family)